MHRHLCHPVFALALCLLVFPAPSVGQATFQIALRVEGHEAILAEARSFFARELRSIPDVEIVDSLPDWEILVLADQMQNGGTPLGIVVAATILEVVDDQKLTEGGAQLSAELRSYLQARPFRLYRQIWVYHGGPDDMPTLARRLVADVDVTVLEALR